MATKKTAASKGQRTVRTSKSVSRSTATGRYVAKATAQRGGSLEKAAERRTTTVAKSTSDGASTRRSSAAKTNSKIQARRAIVRDARTLIAKLDKDIERLPKGI